MIRPLFPHAPPETLGEEWKTRVHVCQEKRSMSIDKEQRSQLLVLIIIVAIVVIN